VVDAWYSSGALRIATEAGPARVGGAGGAAPISITGGAGGAATDGSGTYGAGGSVVVVMRLYLFNEACGYALAQWPVLF
jgi:hypothetical protein